MGDTISTLVFRPPRPTHLKPTRYFFLDIDQDSPLTVSSSLSCVTTNGSCAPTGGSSYQGSAQPPPPTGGRHRIPAFFIKRRDATLTLLFSHGNAEDLGMMHERMKSLSRELDVNVMCYDYTGYGYSTGSPSEDMCYRNIEAAYRYLRNMLGIPANQIILYGRSLGSGPSCYLAAKTALLGESVAGLILHSPFLSIYRIVVNSSNLGVVGDMFPNGRRAADVRCPVFIVHGTADEIVPFSHGLELLNCFPPEYRARPFWAEDLGHNNIEVYLRETFLGRCRHFIARHVLEAHRTGGGLPLTVPPEERAVIDASDLSQHQFYINPTWVAYGKKVLNQAMTSSGSSLHGGIIASLSSDVGENNESRDDEEDGINIKDEASNAYGENWNRNGSIREDWPDYDNVRTVPIGQPSMQIDDDVREDVEVDSTDEDHTAYFESAGGAIADVAGGDLTGAFVDDVDANYHEAEFDRYGSFASGSSSRKHVFKSRKARKLFGRNNTASVKSPPSWSR
mmetsp:Transcript_26218/g.58272  ORF Transcript_26218/g.58272 Transcript_26218/m.58272 type:complete len:508 (+) Transcript_26218:131-1654(+)